MNNPGAALGTFATTEGPFAALLIDGRVYRLAPLLAGRVDGIGANPEMIQILDRWDVCWPIIRHATEQFREAPSAHGMDVNDLRILVPIRPRQIICAGANYRQHVIELMTDHQAGSEAGLSKEERRRHAEKLMDHRAANGQPFAFIKPVSTVLDPFEDLVLPADATQADWELELAVVIGRPAYRVRREKALDHVAGYTIANDISARDRLARRDMPALGFDWIAGKSAPGFLPLGPYIVPSALVENPQDLMLTLTLNGEIKQHGSTADMIFPVARLIEHISTHMRLLPGDIICTGSPSGNGVHFNRFLQPGDVLEGTIEGLGSQRNSCIAEVLEEKAPLHEPFVPLPDMTA